ncbi:MAG: DUF3596 domain-containing protein [Candidatus Polarisedimenticolaceae bacterium]|nr:DUF3596 domain-containing protein [Candidatus Polarisedimenticolaceae bacterium]
MAKGVEVNGKKMRVLFRYEGERIREPLDQVEIETWLSRDMATLPSKTIKDAIAVFRSTYKLYKTRYPATQIPLRVSR